MEEIARKYKVQGPIAYPHIGKFLARHFAKNGILRSELARQIDVADSTSTRYLRQESLQFGILWKMSVVLKHNLLADLALQLPIAFTTPREKELETQLEALQQELNDLKIENRTYKNLLSK